MIGLVVRKVVRNPGLALSLAAGVILAVAMASGIPQYTEGVLESLLHLSLEEREASGDGYPGSIVARTTLWRYGGAGESVDSLGSLDERVVRAMEYGLPVRIRSRLLSAGPFFVRTPAGESATTAGDMVTLEIVEGFEARIRRVGGAAAPTAGEPAGTPGSFERPLPVFLPEEAASARDLRTGERYLLVGAQGPLARDLWVRIQGSFVPDDPEGPFWKERTRGARAVLYADGAALDDASVAAFGFPRLEAEWLCVVEHASLSVRKLPSQLRLIGERQRELAALGASSATPLSDILGEFRRQERAIRLSLLFLQVPVWLLLVFFIADVSALLVRNDESEIAVLMSRGASGAQVLAVYAVIAAGVAACGLVAGPPLGMLAGRILGSTDGFLAFVRRSRLPVTPGPSAYAAAAAAALLFAAVMLPPTVSASRVTIVERRRTGSRPPHRPFWKRAFVDLALLAVSAYGLYGSLARGRILAATGASPAELPLDPLLFLASVLFLLGSSLLLVRLFPLAVELARIVGVGRRSVVAYAALMHLAREPVGRDSAMLFLVFTVAVGIFSASTARTMNRHFEDAIRQRIGADVALSPLWPEPGAEARSVAPADEPQGMAGEESSRPGPSTSGITAPASGDQFTRAAGVRDAIAAAAAGPAAGVPTRVAAVGPEDTLAACRSLPGVARATWVLRVDAASVSDGRGAAASSALMGVTPSEFGRVAWWRRDLYPAGFARLLNLLASRQDGLLVDRSLADERGLRQGDRLTLSWGERSSAQGIVLGVFEHWPGHDPRGASGGGAHLVVANLPYLDAMTQVGAREVWLRRDPAVDRADFYAALGGAGLALVRLDDAGGEIARERAAPFMRGINGVLTLAFLASVAVCMAGLGMHTVVGLRSRTLELGVERAAGLSRLEVTGILALEQSVVLVSAIVAGTVLGGVGGQLFIPVLQTATGAAELIIPVATGAARQDYRNVIAFAAVVLSSNLAVLASYVRRLRVAETLKLGEQ